MPSRSKWTAPCTPGETDWARLAAFIDGEGSISIRLRKSSRSKPCHVVSVVICNTDPSLPLWLKKTFQVGSITTRRTDQFYDRRNHRPVYSWEAQSRCAVWLLRGAMRFFVMKSSQAEICFQLDETMMDLSDGLKLGVSPELFEKRTALKNKLHLMKAQSFVQVKEVVNG